MKWIVIQVTGKVGIVKKIMYISYLRRHTSLLEAEGKNCNRAEIKDIITLKSASFFFLMWWFPNCLPSFRYFAYSSHLHTKQTIRILGQGTFSSAGSTDKASTKLAGTYLFPLLCLQLQNFCFNNAIETWMWTASSGLLQTIMSNIKSVFDMYLYIF